MPAKLNLKGRPACHTLSKTLLMSQNMARTSLPSSSALQKVLYTSTSWLTVESPGINPDCNAVITALSRKKLKKIPVDKLI